jgi:hypothetical protein
MAECGHAVELEDANVAVSMPNEKSIFGGTNTILNFRSFAPESATAKVLIQGSTKGFGKACWLKVGRVRIHPNANQVKLICYTDEMLSNTSL